VALLPAESLDLRHGHAFHADFRQCVPDFIQLERFNNCFDFFHNKSLIFHASGQPNISPYRGKTHT